MRATRQGVPTEPGTIATARRLRREGLSIRAIAARMGVPRSTVGDWVRGEGEACYVKTCWCGERFLARSPKAVSCSRAHALKRYAMFGRLS